MHNARIPRTYSINRPEWLTADEAAAHLRIKVRTLLLWVRHGKVRGYALSGIKRRVWRFRKADLDTALLADSAGVMLHFAVRARYERRRKVKRARHQQGSVVFDKRRRTWTSVDAKRAPAVKLLGHESELPTKSSARNAAEPFRRAVVDGSKQESARGISVKALIVHYREEKMPLEVTREDHMTFGFGVTF